MVCVTRFSHSAFSYSVLNFFPFQMMQCPYIDTLYMIVFPYCCRKVFHGHFISTLIFKFWSTLWPPLLRKCTILYLLYDIGAIHSCNMPKLSLSSAILVLWMRLNMLQYFRFVYVDWPLHVQYFVKMKTVKYFSPSSHPHERLLIMQA